MTNTRARSRGLSLVVAALLLLLTPVPAPSQEAAPAPPPPPEKPPAEILAAAAGEQTAANGEASASQERVNQLDDETQRLLVRYRTAVGEAESIKSYSDQLRLQIQSQEEDIASIESAARRGRDDRARGHAAHAEDAGHARRSSSSSTCRSCSRSAASGSQACATS